MTATWGGEVLVMTQRATGPRGGFEATDRVSLTDSGERLVFERIVTNDAGERPVRQVFRKLGPHPSQRAAPDPLPSVELPSDLERRDGGALHTLARLRSGASLSRAQAAVDGVVERLRREHPEHAAREMSVVPERYARPLEDQSRTNRLGVGVVLGITGLVLLVGGQRHEPADRARVQPEHGARDPDRARPRRGSRDHGCVVWRARSILVPDLCPGTADSAVRNARLARGISHRVPGAGAACGTDGSAAVAQE
jgi:hypothetical protein